MIVGVTKWGAGSPACTRTPTIAASSGRRWERSVPQKQRRPHDRRGCPRPFGLDSSDPQGTTVGARPIHVRVLGLNLSSLSQ